MACRPAAQTLFFLRYAESNSVRRIAKQVGKPDAAVKVSLHRSRSTLLEQIPELGQFLDAPSRAAG